MCKPSSFSSGLYLHEFNDLALRNEVDIGIGQGNVVLENSPFMDGTNFDLKKFQSKLKNEVSYGESIMADCG